MAKKHVVKKLVKRVGPKPEDVEEVEEVVEEDGAEDQPSLLTHEEVEGSISTAIPPLESHEDR